MERQTTYEITAWFHQEKKQTGTGAIRQINGVYYSIEKQALLKQGKYETE
jgi:hypothetical protein